MRELVSGLQSIVGRSRPQTGKSQGKYLFYVALHDGAPWFLLSTLSFQGEVKKRTLGCS